VDAGTAGYIQIWEGTEPALPTTSITDGVNSYNLLAELTMNGTAFSSYTNGVATAATITGDTSANKSGTAQFWRLWTQSGGTVIFQGLCGTSASDLNFNTTTITSGSAVNITSLTFTMPVA
jgi:hypothetical protein